MLASLILGLIDHGTENPTAKAGMNCSEARSTYIESLMTRNSRRKRADISIDRQILDLILSNAQDDIVICDREGVVLDVSANLLPVYGLAPEQWKGRSVYDMERQGILKPSVTVLSLRTGKPAEVVQQTATGRTVAARGFPILDEEGKVSRVVCFSRDNTDMELLKREVDYSRSKQRESRHSKGGRQVAIGTLQLQSPASLEIFDLLLRVAPSAANLLFTGETGVGKTAFARTAHTLSDRADGPFVELNCGAIPEALFESELFGYEAGSFTGANRGGKKGLVEQAHNGTLFLDEVGELTLAHQAKLLRFIQDRQFTRVGGNRTCHSDCRIMSATNRDLRARVSQGDFRLDLYYRLSVVPIAIPPLRDRPADISAIVESTLKRLNSIYPNRKSLDDRVMQWFEEQPWMGNVRELENMLERLFVQERGDTIRWPMPPEVDGNRVSVKTFDESQIGVSQPEMALREEVDQLEYNRFASAASHSRSTYEVAKRLGVSQTTVVRKLKKFGLRISR
jgi:transcriptional regulator with PAS, ATPase and Fis domain